MSASFFSVLRARASSSFSCFCAATSLFFGGLRLLLGRGQRFLGRRHRDLRLVLLLDELEPEVGRETERGPGRVRRNRRGRRRHGAARDVRRRLRRRRRPGRLRGGAGDGEREGGASTVASATGTRRVDEHPFPVGILPPDLQVWAPTPRQDACPAFARCASTPRHFAPRKVLVDPRLARQAEHPLAEDVLHDVGGAALDRVGLHPQERLLRVRQVHRVRRPIDIV